jgi:transcriptional regulator with XRE-family HTH domain
MVGLAARLKQLRMDRGLTQQQAAQAVGVTRSVISGYETEMRFPSLDILVALARLYGVTTDYLLCLDNRESIDVSGLSEDEISTISHMVDLLRTKNRERN